MTLPRLLPAPYDSKNLTLEMTTEISAETVDYLNILSAIFSKYEATRKSALLPFWKQPSASIACTKFAYSYVYVEIRNTFDRLNRICIIQPRTNAIRWRLLVLHIAKC
jgi:hypothetical protein